VRGATLTEKNREYVQAARLIGLPRRRIVVAHILPNVLTAVPVLATIQLAVSIILEATLSFVGLGIPPTQPSLGTLIRIGNGFLLSGEWWIAIFGAPDDPRDRDQPARRPAARRAQIRGLVRAGSDRPRLR
jgi:peptide/nickel transport system permease protein